MPIKTQLIIDHKRYNLMECFFNFSKPRNDTDRERVKSKENSIIVLIDFDKQKELVDWAESDTATRNGRIIFFNEDETGIKFSLIFQKGYCIDLSIEHSDFSETKMRAKLKIRADKMSITTDAYISDFPSPCLN
ncbi:type VI secretion system tube protein TssD [Aquimarina aquimarini]|uniref:type VI secretion system tube protein TssD n=1 Tax=Aquimarina aquimarini TaxID=1191734 RepID=UPI001F43F610|nr:type VI secretion system tube protein TssD [Aquimarina aquimarini]